ncbi:IS1634 family transposase, partial [Arthrobacter sp. H5]|uniref:IS1634 family transposase n=2 Tax=Arthrobacter sp. H5 TaxID=1267973 RepID=UPI000564D2E0
EQQPRIEKQLARTHLGPEHNPERLALFDLSSSWVTGTHNPLAKFGYSRDRKRGCEQIEYGMLATRQGLPIAVRVFPGNTADPAAFIQIASEIHDLSGVDDLVMVGDRGMITNARVEDLKKDTNFSWVTALRNTDIQKLADDEGSLQMSLFDEQNLAEITHPKYPGERLIACRNPALAAKRAHKRTELLKATEEKLEAIKKAVQAGRSKNAGTTGVRVGKTVGTYNMAKHFHLVITDKKFTYERNTESIAREADLDGIYVIRTNVPETTMDAPEAVRTYKSLANVEKIFKTLKSRDLGIRPIRHYTEPRTRAHVFLCMLAAHLTWHLRTAWAPLTFTDENRPTPEEPVTKVARSTDAERKASTRKLDDGTTATSYQDLLAHMATRTRNTTKLTKPQTPEHDSINGQHEPASDLTFELLTVPTARQRRAMDLVDHHARNHRK